MRHATAAGLLLCLAGPAAAQGYGLPGYGYVPPGGYAPNYYNRQTQPLSPYLNLLNRGNLPGVNYFYGARPGLPAGGVNQYGQVPQPPLPVGTAAGGFLPQATIPYDPNQPVFETGGQPVQLRSAAHPATFGNWFAGHGGYQSVTAGGTARFGGQPAGGQQRPALGGLGATGRPGGTGVGQPRTR